MEHYTFADGRQIPCIGYGCYNAFGKEIENAVRAALDTGYRYIDSAEYYKNEPDIGPAIRDYAGRREEIFILSKAWPSSFDDMEVAAARSIRNLQAEYLDAYLMHWPGTKEDRMLRAWEQMLKLVDKGIVLTPGVSNFNEAQMERLKEEFGAYPLIHEIECHPAYQQQETIAWCRERNIRIISYQPINRTADLSLPTVQALAEKYGRTPAQIILRWHVQRDHLPIPKSSHADRIRENFSVFDFALEPADLQAMDALDTGIRCGKDPLTFPEGF